MTKIDQTPPTAAPSGSAPEPRPENERLILSLIRQQGSMSKAEIARASGLSAQSATVIVKRLEAEGLLQPGESVRGKVGQPSTPYKLAPEGALSLGFKVGRQSAEVAVMGLDYSVIDHKRLRYDYPVFDVVRDQIIVAARRMIRNLGPERAGRLLGAGLAIPDALGSWESAVGAPVGSMAAWDSADMRGDLEQALALPVFHMNDASAACLAALKVGAATQARSFLYVYVGTFAGGGVAIDGRVYEGLTGNAGAIGSMPMHVARGGGTGTQLIGSASLHDLESSAAQAGLDPQVYYEEAPLSAEAEAVLRRWIATAAPALAFALVAGQAILDFDTMVLDTSLADPLRARLVQAVRDALPAYDMRGMRDFTVVSGDVGVRARSLGSALLPFQAVTEYDLMS